MLVQYADYGSFLEFESFQNKGYIVFLSFSDVL